VAFLRQQPIVAASKATLHPPALRGSAVAFGFVSALLMGTLRCHDRM